MLIIMDEHKIIYFYYTNKAVEQLYNHHYMFVWPNKQVPIIIRLWRGVKKGGSNWTLIVIIKYSSL